METLLPFLLVGGMLALIGLIVYAGYVQEKKRTQALQGLAESLGLPFYPKGDDALVQTLHSFQLFSQGSSRDISNMIHGQTEEVDLAIFDYKYVTGSGKNRSTWSQTVVYFDSRTLGITDFSIRPESVFHKLGSVLGLKDINFADHAEFSKRFWLQGSDVEQVRAMFQRPVLDWFVKMRDISAEGERTRLLVYRPNKRAKPEDLKQLMADAFELYGMLKRQDTNV